MFFTIITINYNNQNGLRRTIESVVGQTYRDYEYIIIDGASTDNSIEVVQEFGDKITSWVSEKDRGIYHAMNKGVAKAHGDYCIFMNSGDFFYDNTVLDIVSKCCVNEDVIVGKVVIDNQDHIISPPPITGNLTLYHLYSGSIPHQGSFIRTELLRKYPYDEDLKISSDWKFFVQTLILDNCSIRYLDEYIACYDMNGFSAANPKLMREEKDDVLAKMFPPRVLEDYHRMKDSECLTQTLTPLLRKNFGVDKLVFKFGKLLLKFRSK
jgi:glycosyltransferase involved in cell wall biosynthesis